MENVAFSNGHWHKNRQEILVSNYLCLVFRQILVEICENCSARALDLLYRRLKIDPGVSNARKVKLLSTVMRWWVFLIDSLMVSMSKGLMDLKLMTSVEIPSLANSSAAVRQW